MKKIRNTVYSIIAIITISIAFVFSSSALDINGGECGESLTYTYNETTKEVIISGVGSMNNYTAGTSPFFAGDVESIIIENGVTSIGDFAFEGANIKCITIPNSVTNIGNRAFIDCDRLEKIVLPNSITTIEDYAFWGCGKLESIVLPRNLIDLGEFSFSDCSSIKKVIIPCGLAEIKKGTFMSCEALQELTISGDIKNIGREVFRFCYALEKVYLSDSIVSIDECAFEYCYSLSDIYYEGSQSAWNEINILQLNNNYLISANVSYNVHIHDYIPNITKEPTCWREGVTTYTCSCGDSYTEPIGKIEHEYYRWEVKKKPKCTQPGLEWAYCLVCDGEFEREIPATGHTVINYTRRATPDEDGAYVEACDVCNEVFSEEPFARPSIFNLSFSKCTYNGKAQTPDVTVSDDDGNTLVEGEDYEVQYASGRKLPGKYDIRILFKGEYLGEKHLTLTVVPKATTGVKAKTQTTKAITLSWSKTTGATGYRVYQYSPSKSKYVLKKSLKETAYKLTRLKAGTTYKLKIRPYTKTKDGTVIWGSYSSVLTTATMPATPTLKLGALSNNKTTLSWNNVSGETGYQVYYSTSKNGEYKKMSDVAANKVTYTTSKLTSGKTYYFKVRACKKAGDATVYGDFSSVKSVTVPIVYYITKSGTKYHVDGCRSLSKSKIQISYSNAVARGYKPCSSCIK